MSEDTEGKLSVNELYLLLDYLRDYIRSDHAVIKGQIDAPDTCGNIVHLNGEAFLSGFRDYLNSRFLDTDELLGKLCFIMELSAYVRHGGIKAMVYRLETGRTSMAEDYFDTIASQLALAWRENKFVSTKQDTHSNLLRRLKEINQGDELRVSSAITEIDELLLELSQKLEQVSLDELAQKDPGLETASE